MAKGEGNKRPVTVHTRAPGSGNEVRAGVLVSHVGMTCEETRPRDPLVAGNTLSCLLPIHALQANTHAHAFTPVSLHALPHTVCECLQPDMTLLTTSHDRKHVSLAASIHEDAGHTMTAATHTHTHTAGVAANNELGTEKEESRANARTG